MAGKGKGKKGEKLAAGIVAVAEPLPSATITMDSSDKRISVVVPRVVDYGVACPHCGECYGHKVTNTYPNGNRRKACGGCGRGFVVMLNRMAGA